MTAIIWTNVTDVAADVAALNLPVAVQTAVLLHVNTALDVTLFGTGDDTDPRLYLCRVNLAAHIAITMGSGAFGPSGPALEDQAGSLMTQYANTVAVSSNPYDTTSYGRTYRMLIKPLGGPRSMSGFIPPIGWYPGSGYGC